jgi:hypothetical protein
MSETVYSDSGATVWHKPQPDVVFVVVAYTGNSAEIDGAYIEGVYADRDKATEAASDLTRTDRYCVEASVSEERVLD